MTPGDLHQRLLEAGISIDKGELERGEAGPSTTAAVEQFQRLNGLAVDGIAGPKTIAALTGGSGRLIAPGWRRADQVREPVRPVVEWAINQIGEAEKPSGSNRSPRIDAWTGMLGRPVDEQGPPWCAYFCSAAYCYSEPPSPFGTLASAFKIAAWAKAFGRVLQPGEPVSPGDLWLVLRADFHGHVEIVVGTTNDGRLSCVGGNVQNAVRGTVRARGDATMVVRAVR